ncbi:hypothetical protein BRD22_04940, partial [Halobacteriales archaeon SW_8_68_21]
ASGAAASDAAASATDPSVDETAGAGAVAAASEVSDESASGGDEAVSTGARAESDDAPPVDSDLLSNEEQVLRLVESKGGRMKQKRVAEELDWTAAKTSQVVTGLRDEGDLDGFRLGRENVLSLPDYDPEENSSADDGDGSGEGDGGGGPESGDDDPGEAGATGTD